MELNAQWIDSPPVAAATVMVLRDTADGLQVLMVRRHPNSPVLGGSWVFPGGKVGVADAAFPPDWCDLPADAMQAALADAELPLELARALHVAAIRETLEECGLFIGGADNTPQTLAGFAAALRAGSAIQALLGGHRLALATSSLVPWSRWITPLRPSVTNKRFDTRFFVTQLPVDQLAVADAHEVTEVLWTTPAQALTRYWSRDIDLAPPQIISLQQLARFTSADAALRWGRGRPPATVLPESFDLDGRRVVCYPGDAGHSVKERAWDGPTRLTYVDGRFEPVDGLSGLLAPGLAG